MRPGRAVRQRHEEPHVAAAQTVAEVDTDNTFYTITQSDSNFIPLAANTLAGTKNSKALENDGTCGENACSGAGICFQETCYCKRFYSGDDCEIDTAHPGLSTKITMTFYSVAVALGLAMGAFLASIYNQNGKKLLK